MFRGHGALQFWDVKGAHTAPILVRVFFLTLLLLHDIIDQVVIYSSVIKLRKQTLASSKHKGL